MEMAIGVKLSVYIAIKLFSHIVLEKRKLNLPADSVVCSCSCSCSASTLFYLYILDREYKNRTELFVSQ